MLMSQTDVSADITQLVKHKRKRLAEISNGQDNFYRVQARLESEGRLNYETVPRLRRFFRSHKPVTSVTMSKDCKFVYYGSKDGSVVEWDIPSEKYSFIRDRKCSANLHLTQFEVLSLQMHHDGTIVFGGRDRQLHVLDPRTGGIVKTFSGHKDAITSIGSSDNLFSASLDRSIKKWDMRSNEPLEALYGHQDGILAVDHRELVSSSMDRTVRIWNASDDKHTVYRGALSPIDSVVSINRRSFVCGEQNGTIHLWNRANRRPAKSYTNAHGEYPGNGILSVAHDENSSIFASGSGNNTINIWEILNENDFELKSTMSADGFINAMCLSANVLVAGVGREPRLGRWITSRSTNGLLICRVDP